MFISLLFWYTYFFKYKKIKIPSKIDSDATDVPMGLKINTQEPGETNENEVFNDQHATAPAQTHFSPGSQIYHSNVFFNRWLKVIGRQETR